MAYSDFTLERVVRSLGIKMQEADVFGPVEGVAIPAWLEQILGKRTRLALINEKSRSECIVAPVLWASRDLSPVPLAIYSGQRFDVDPERGLVGECDFILAIAPPVPPLQGPIATIVEANKNDIEAGLGQCVAQMVAADLFNQEAGHSGPIFGCVTSGEIWQFLQLVGPIATIDKRQYYLDDLSDILAVIQTIIARSGNL